MIHIVSSRLPVTVKNGHVVPSNGGLVRLWNNYQENKNTKKLGIWFGVDSSVDQIDNIEQNHQFLIQPLIIQESVYHEFYNLYSNSTLWFLLHEMQSLYELPSEKSWHSYQLVNTLMANLVISKTALNDTVIINDYHFLCLPRLLKQKRPDLKIIFYLHTPFPSPESFFKIKESEILLLSMLEAETIGVQTNDIKKNITTCIKTFTHHQNKIELLEKVESIHTLPVAIDYNYFSDHSRRLKNTAKSEAHPHLFTFLGVDRLDPIKGLKEKVQGYESYLDHYPQAHGSVQLKQFIIPTRENCDIYKKYKDELFTMIESVNDRFSTPYWVPIDFYYYQMDENILIQSYLSSDALIVTSLADGMNLVAYEYLACQREENPGILCLSSRAGSAQYLDSALQFDPRSIDAIQQCFHDAQSLSLKNRQVRLQRSLAYMKKYTVSQWRQSLIATQQTNKSSEKIFT